MLSKLVILFFSRQWWLMPVTFLKKSWNFSVFVELQFHIAPILIFRKLKKKRKKKNCLQLNNADVHIVPWVQPTVTRLCMWYPIPPEVTYWIENDHSWSTSAWYAVDWLVIFQYSHVKILLFLNFISFDCSINGRFRPSPFPLKYAYVLGKWEWAIYSLLSIKQKWDTVWYSARILYWMLTVILPLT